MIKSYYSIKILKLLFNKIVKQLHKNFYQNKKILGRNTVMIPDSSSMNENETSKKNSYELTNPQVIKFLFYYELVVDAHAKTKCDQTARCLLQFIQTV
jgi:hypothetical protein